MGAETVTLTSTKTPRVSVTALLDQAGAIVTGGYGGWEVVNRPRRLGVTNWGGRNPFTMTLALVLDGHATFESVETKCSRLERLALPHSKTGVPPVISLNGESAIPHSDLPWVIDSLEWGEVIRSSSGNRTRQHVVVSLLSYVEVDKIQVSAAENSRGKSVSGAHTVNVRQGDTLGKIAARELGNAKHWKDIKALNPSVRDPNNLAGIPTVKVPAKK